MLLVNASMRKTSLVGLVGCALLVGCAATDAAEDDSDFSSREATLLDFEFDGELVTDQSFDPKSEIEAQLLFTVGHLNADRAVARLDRHTVSNISTTQEGNLTRIRYHVKIPVAWGSKKNLPKTYELKLPKHVDFSSQQALFDRVKNTCIEFGAHDPDIDSFFYYYRPKQAGCTLGPDDVTTSLATATRSKENTRNKYPEYDKVWEDKALKVVAIFGKFEDGKTSGDAGIDGYNEFVNAVRRELGPAVRTTPAKVPDSPGVSVPDVQFDADLPGGRSVQVVALLVDNVRQGGPQFNARYNALSTDADLIAYNGHAGLGQNVRALAQMGRFKPKKYQIFFMNGCDTFAYVDGSLAQTRAKLNPDDPTGTKYMEFVTNAMPSFFSSMPTATMALIKGLESFDKPLTYDQIFANIDRSEVVLVTGEEDNTFHP
jgi:hypothetical protein